MKANLLALLLLLLFPLFISGQTVVFHEDFEAPGFDDSLVNTSSPVAGYTFSVNTRLHSGTGSFCCDSLQVKPLSTVYLTSNVFSTIGSVSVKLTFDHICRVYYLDRATIEFSLDSGNTWTLLSNTYYRGKGVLSLYSGFSTDSYYSSWYPASPGLLEQDSWWKHETFDLSAIMANCQHAKIRFTLSDQGPVGASSYSGWFIDNIKVMAHPYETEPPVIGMVSPNLSGVIPETGPWTIKTKITDASGLDTTFLIYSINNNLPDTMGMFSIGGDTMACTLPVLNNLDEVCWHIESFDNTPGKNMSSYPDSACITFKAYNSMPLPYYENFDGIYSYWMPSQGTSNTTNNWQLGTPSYSPTNTAYSAPQCWDVNLNYAYTNEAYCILTSPRIDFTNAFNAQMSFYLNYLTQTTYDGTRMEYTTDGTNWSELGTYGDPAGTNWYNHANLNASHLPGWTGNSNGWKASAYDLSFLDHAGPNVQFRFIFQSDGNGTIAGISLDQFAITVPPWKEAACKGIITANGQCGMGNEAISIKIYNGGASTISGGLTAGYRKSPGSATVLEIVTDSIPAGDSLIYQFNTLANFQAIDADSLFAVKAWIQLSGDQSPYNDTANLQVNSKFTPDAPVVSSTTVMNNSVATLTATSPYTVKWYDQPVGGVQLGTGLTFTTPLVYNTMQFFAQATASNGCSGSRGAGTVNVTFVPTYDAACLSLIQPSSGLNLDNEEIVKVLVKNYGTNAISSFPVRYKLNNQAVVTETVNSVLQAGDTLTYTFNAKINLSAYGTYTLKTWTQLGSDPNPENDTITKTIVNSPFNYCISKANYTTYSDIGNVKISNINNGNPVPITNNTTATKAYTNFTASVSPIQLIQGQTYSFSVTAISAFTSFPCMCKVYADWNFDGLFDETTELAFLGGPTISTNTTLTGYITVPPDAAPGITRFRVVMPESTTNNFFACTTYSYGETEDYSALIIPQSPIDAGISELSQPAECYINGSYGPIVANLKNLGSTPITAMSVGYILDNNPAVITPWTGIIPPNSSLQISFPAISWPDGTHTLRVFSQLINDTLSFNDTAYRIVMGIPCDTLPYTNDFNLASTFYATNGMGSTNWIYGTPITPNWPSPAHSAPSLWATNLNMTSYDANSLSYLTTQAFDLSNVKDAKISFWYNALMPTSGDGVQLQYSKDLGKTWIILGTLNDPMGQNWYSNNITNFGNAWAGNSSGWKKATLAIPSLNYTPKVRFRFVFYSNPFTQMNGFAVDDFSITYQPRMDAGIENLLSPPVSGNNGSSLPVSVKVRNYGTFPINTMTITYQLDSLSPVSQAWSGLLLPDSNVVITFPDISFSMETHSIVVHVSIPGDTIGSNDILVKAFPCLFQLNNFNNLQQWVQDNVIGQHGVVSNVTYFGGPISSGQYNTGCSTLGLTSGVLLTTGKYSEAIGPNTAEVGYNPGYYGVDHDLVQIENGGYCYNAATIEFDLIPVADGLSFKYVFGSEEYPAYVYATQNDVFGIFINGPGINGPFENNAKNMAVLPGTNTEVSVKTVHNGTAFNGPCVNCQYLINNIGGQTLQYNAYTTLMTAYQTVIPGQQYHIKMVIADFTDTNFDSGVFIESGDFDDHKIKPEVVYHHNFLPGKQPMNTTEGCIEAEVKFSRTLATADPAYFVIDSVYGTAVNGVDYSLISDTLWFQPNQNTTSLFIQPLSDGITEGTEYIQLKVKTSTTQNTDTILIIPIHDNAPILNDMISDTILGPAQFHVQLWVNPSQGIAPYQVTWQPANSLDNPAILNPVATPSQSTWYYVEITDSDYCSVIKDSVLVTPTLCSMIRGTISYNNTLNSPMNNVSVGLFRNDTLVSTTISDNTGFYSFDSICTPGIHSLKLSCSKPWGGANAIDAMLVQKKIVGLVTLAPLRLKAADVNTNNLINSLDVLLIMRRFIGQISSLPSGDWLFGDAALTLGPGVITEKDINALCYGDVDGSLVPGLKTPPAIQLSQTADLVMLKPGQFVELPVYGKNQSDFHSLSLIMQFDTLTTDIAEIVPQALHSQGDLSTFMYNISGNEIRIAWFSLEGISPDPEVPLFSLKLKAENQGPVNLETVEGCAMTDFYGQILEDACLFIPKTLIASEEIGVAVFPNPTHDQLDISCTQPTKGDITVSLRNVVGQELLRQERSGSHDGRFNISIKDYPCGIYSLTMEFKYQDNIQIRTMKIVKD